MDIFVGTASKLQASGFNVTGREGLGNTAVTDSYIMNRDNVILSPMHSMDDLQRSVYLIGVQIVSSYTNSKIQQVQCSQPFV